MIGSLNTSYEITPVSRPLIHALSDISICNIYSFRLVKRSASHSSTQE